MPKSPERQRDWIDSAPGPIRLPERWHVLPHELVFTLFLGATWLRLWREVGFTHTSTLLFGIFLLTLLWLIVWGSTNPRPIAGVCDCSAASG
jgi:Mg/Co/Ni transporter MgtE